MRKTHKKTLIFCGLLSIAILLVIAQIFFIKKGDITMSLINCSLLQITIIYLFISLWNLQLHEKEVTVKDKIGICFIFLSFTLIINAIPTLTILLSFFNGTQHNPTMADMFTNPLTKINDFPFVILQNTKDASFMGIIVGLIFYMIILIKNLIKNLLNQKDNQRGQSKIV